MSTAEEVDLVVVVLNPSRVKYAPVSLNRWASDGKLEGSRRHSAE